jgi:hypothetical protein
MNKTANKQFKPTQLRGTCFVLNSTKTSSAPSVGLTERYKETRIQLASATGGLIPKNT